MTAPALFTVLLSLHMILPGFSGVLAGSPLPFCPPSACGQLRNVSYPFRFKGDPEGCGSAEYELDCEEGNRAVLNFLSGKYYVVKLSYEHSYEFLVGYGYPMRTFPDRDHTTIRVVDARLAIGSCPLPSRSLSPASFLDDGRYHVESSWAAFVNCSRMINDTMYEYVACMSTGSTHAYVVHGYAAYELGYLQPSCRAVSLIPLADDADDALASGADVAEVLRMGFELMRLPDRSGPASMARVVRVCLRYAFRSFLQNIREGQLFRYPVVLEMSFYACLRSPEIYEKTIWARSRSKVDEGYSLVLAMALGALHLLVVFILVGRFIIAPLSIFVLLLRKLHRENASVDTVEKFLQNQNMLMPARFTYPEIIGITNHFEKKLGQGGFGSVFQGKLPGDYLVAVKMLNDSRYNGEDFINEVSTIGQIHHINILQLIGFCSEGNKRALIYEYMPNGSLDKYIFLGTGEYSSLGWEKLHEIALGIARGVEYLHKGCDMCILHFDIKPHNVLLDHNFTPKVSDFGLARLYPKEYSLVSISAARGTVGYIAPELISRSFGPISYKSDVYSFGMLLLEMAGARKNRNATRERSSELYFPTWIYDRLNEERVLKQDNVNDEIGETERKLCTVGLWCIQMKPSNRPSMSMVIEMLEGSTDALQMPPKPFFSSLPISTVMSSLDPLVEDLSMISEV